MHKRIPPRANTSQYARKHTSRLCGAQMQNRIRECLPNGCACQQLRGDIWLFPRSSLHIVQTIARAHSLCRLTLEVLKVYGTPRCHPVTWYGARLLTNRGHRDVANAVKPLCPIKALCIAQWAFVRLFWDRIFRGFWNVVMKTNIQQLPWGTYQHQWVARDDSWGPTEVMLRTVLRKSVQS
jgi:hypothetical protein